MDPDQPAGQLFILDEELREWVSPYGAKPELVTELTEEFERIRDAGRSR